MRHTAYTPFPHVSLGRLLLSRTLHARRSCAAQTKSRKRVITFCSAGEAGLLLGYAATACLHAARPSGPVNCLPLVCIMPLENYVFLALPGGQRSAFLQRILSIAVLQAHVKSAWLGNLQNQT